MAICVEAPCDLLRLRADRPVDSCALLLLADSRSWPGPEGDRPQRVAVLRAFWNLSKLCKETDTPMLARTGMSLQTNHPDLPVLGIEHSMGRSQAPLLELQKMRGVPDWRNEILVCPSC